MVKNFLKTRKDVNTQVQKADSVYPKQDKHKENHILKHRIVQLLKNLKVEKS